MLKRMPDRRMDVLGPFGLMCEVGLHFYRKDATDANRIEDCKALHFQHAWDDGIKLSLYGDDGSKSLIDIPDGATVDWFMAFLS
jgi:hypothetical protein